MTGSRDDLAWLAPPVAAGLVVYLVYLRTNPYPAHGAGLFLTMAARVSEHGYALPATVPHYTRSGVPFAYPPLAIYAIAGLRAATGLGPLATSRLLPGPLVILGLVPTYLLARELVESAPGGSLVATLVAVNPQLLDWHLSAGGLVRAPAFLFAVTGLYAFRRRAGSGSRRWLALATAGFGATLLTHPTYALFFAVSALALFAAGDRSVDGLIDGAVVGLGGVVLAAPWWSVVVGTHGLDVFLGATGTHGGVVGGVVGRLLSVTVDPVTVLLALVVGSVVVAELATGRHVLVAWLAAVALVLAQPRFTLFVATFPAVAALRSVPVTLRWLRTPGPESTSVRGRTPALLLVLAVALGALVGAAYVRDDTAAPRLGVTPNPVDRTDLEAMEWARSSTRPDSTFVVLGDAGEWFPFFAERTLLVSPWGAEWEGPRAYDRHTVVFRTVSRCGSERCLTGALARGGFRPDYVYVPKDRYPVQGTPHRPSGRLVGELRRSARYTLVFENRGVAVFRLDGALGPVGASNRLCPTE